MFPFTINMRIQIVLFLFVFSLTYAHDRKITSKLNPGCEIKKCNSTDTTLIHIQADGTKDTIHQIWDFTRGIPTFIFVIAGINSTVNVTWLGTEPKSFNISETPKYSFSAVFDKLYEYDDLKDVGYFTPDSPQKIRELRHVTWRRKNMVTRDDEVMVELEAKVLRANIDRDEVIGVKLDLLPFKDYAVDLPHLIHTANSTLIDFNLIDLETSSTYNASRFALHTILASTDPATDRMHCAMRKSLDDEHTPGVFEIIEMKTPSSYNGEGGFIQFRPVAYTEPTRSVATSTVAHVSTFQNSSLPQRSTVGKFYEHFDKQNLLIEEIFISFGEPGDGYYAKHNYTAWSFTIGYGAPPVEGFSLFVILVISIGLGVPVLLTISGVVYVLTRRCKQNQPRRFSNVD